MSYRDLPPIGDLPFAFALLKDPPGPATGEREEMRRLLWLYSEARAQLGTCEAELAEARRSVSNPINQGIETLTDVPPVVSRPTKPDYTEWHDRLIPAAEHYARHFEGEPNDLLTIALNAFYAGAAWAVKNPPVDVTPEGHRP